MPQAKVLINTVPGSNNNLPIGNIVQLDNQDLGGEISYLWSILDQPPGAVDSLSSTTIKNPTFIPKKEGTYLIKLIVNLALPDEQTDSVIAAVRQIKTLERVPAAGETTQDDVADGWATAMNSLLRKIDQQLADPGTVVGMNTSGTTLTVGDVLRVTSGAIIKPGLPGQEIVPGFVKCPASTVTNLDELLVVVESGVDGSTNIPDGELVKAKFMGKILALPLGAGAVGDTVYVTDTATISVTPGTFRRRCGSIMAVSGGNRDVWFDGVGGQDITPINAPYVVYGNPGMLTNTNRIDGLNATGCLGSIPYTFMAADVGTIALVAKRWGTPAGDIFQAQSETGSPLVQIQSDGTTTFNWYKVQKPLFQPPDTTTVGAIIRKHSAPATADLLQIQNESGSTVHSVLANFDVGLKSNTPTAALDINQGGFSWTPINTVVGGEFNYLPGLKVNQSQSGLNVGHALATEASGDLSATLETYMTSKYFTSAPIAGLPAGYHYHLIGRYNSAISFWLNHFGGLYTRGAIEINNPGSGILNILAMYSNLASGDYNYTLFGKASSPAYAAGALGYVYNSTLANAYAFLCLNTDGTTSGLVVRGGGHVGVGTLPSLFYKLDVLGDTNLAGNTVHPYNSGNSVLEMIMGNGNSMYFSPLADSVRISSNHTGSPIILEMDKWGQSLFGNTRSGSTEATSAVVDVRGNSSVAGYTVNDVDCDLRVISSTNNPLDGGILKLGGLWGATAFIKTIALSGRAGNLVFGTRTAAVDTSMSAKMILDYNGFLGVGTNAPSQRIHAVGTILGDGSIVGNQIGCWGKSTSNGGVYGESFSGAGCYGISTGNHGVLGTSTNSDGVNGSSTNAAGVYGSSTTRHGVTGVASTATYAGVYGTNSGTGYGVQGVCNGGYGVYGQATTGRGVFGSTTGAFGVALYALATGTGGHAAEVYATNTDALYAEASATSAIGIYGVSSNIATGGTGVSGRSAGPGGTGVYGIGNVGRGIVADVTYPGGVVPLRVVPKNYAAGDPPGAQDGDIWFDGSLGEGHLYVWARGAKRRLEA